MIYNYVVTIYANSVPSISIHSLIKRIHFAIDRFFSELNDDTNKQLLFAGASCMYIFACIGHTRAPQLVLSGRHALRHVLVFDRLRLCAASRAATR